MDSNAVYSLYYSAIKFSLNYAFLTLHKLGLAVQWLSQACVKQKLQHD